MGGIVITLKNDDVARALISFAGEYGITHAVVGRPGDRSWLQRFKPTLLEMLIEGLPGVDLVIA